MGPGKSQLSLRGARLRQAGPAYGIRPLSGIKSRARRLGPECDMALETSCRGQNPPEAEMVANVPGGPLAQLLPEARVGGELPQAIRGLFQVGVGPEQVGLGEYPLRVLDGNQLLIHQQ